MGTGNMTTVELVIPLPTKLWPCCLPEQGCSYMKINKVTSHMNIHALVEV